MKKQIHLAFDLSWTSVETQWRNPGSWVDKHHPNIGMFEEVARTAERGGIDVIFLRGFHWNSKHLGLSQSTTRCATVSLGRAWI